MNAAFGVPQTIHSHSNRLTLDELLARLARHPAVDGLVLLGSVAQESLAPASDYDLLITLSEMPAPLHVAVTQVDNRLTDVIFVTTAEIDQILETDSPLSRDSWPGRAVHWLQAGRIAFDRHGRVERAQRKAVSGDWLEPVRPIERYQAWFSINYNLQHNRRMLASNDPVYLTALDVRLLYSLQDLWFHYFLLRGVESAGEKAGVRYVQAHDPAFLELFRRCLAEADRGLRFRLYERLAALVTAPAGGLWDEGVTAIQLHAETGLRPEVVATALRFWESLASGAGAPEPEEAP